MSAATNYQLNDAAAIGPLFITSDETTLLASARAGDAVAFECLVMPHRHTLLRVTQRILRNREDAEDAVQTAFLDAFRNLNGFRGHSQFSSWLTRIAMNAALMRVRVSRRKKETSLEDVTETGETRTRFYPVETSLNPEQEYLSKEGRALFEEGLKRLRPIYVEVLQRARIVGHRNSKTFARAGGNSESEATSSAHQISAACAVDSRTQTAS
jgi:RNA polymerase sigma-70 factor (ECF subfamily)